MIRLLFYPNPRNGVARFKFRNSRPEFCKFLPQIRVFLAVLSGVYQDQVLGPIVSLHAIDVVNNLMMS